MQLTYLHSEANLGAAHLRGDLEHQEDLQALHVNTAIQQLHGLV